MNNPQEHVLLSGITNVTVDLQNSNLYFQQGNAVALYLNNPTNVTLKNFTVDYLNLPFTQVTVTGVSTSNPPTVSFTPNAGFPLPSSFNAITIPPEYINNGFIAYIFRNGEPLDTTGRMQVASGALNDNNVQLAGTEPWTTPLQLNHPAG